MLCRFLYHAHRRSLNTFRFCVRFCSLMGEKCMQLNAWAAGIAGQGEAEPPQTAQAWPCPHSTLKPPPASLSSPVARAGWGGLQSGTWGGWVWYSGRLALGSCCLVLWSWGHPPSTVGLGAPTRRSRAGSTVAGHAHPALWHSGCSGCPGLGSSCGGELRAPAGEGRWREGQG